VDHEVKGLLGPSITWWAGEFVELGASRTVDPSTCNVTLASTKRRTGDAPCAVRRYFAFQLIRNSTFSEPSLALLWRMLTTAAVGT